MKKKNYVLFIILSLTVGMLIGFACSFLTSRLFGGHTESFVYFSALVTLCIAFYLHIILHEAGHLVCGLLTGYTFLSFRIGSFMWIKQGGVLRFRRMSLAGTAGQCLLGPPELKDGRMPYVLYNIGGVLANLLAAVIAVIMVMCFGENPWVVLAFTLFAVVGAVTALMNGLPLRNSVINNDGANAVAMGKSPEALRAFYTQMKIAEMTASGVRLKDMPAELFETGGNADMKNVMVTTIAVFRANRLIDAHEFEEAKRYIDFLLDGDSAVSGIYRYMLSCDRIYLELLNGRDMALINKLRDNNLLAFMKQMKNNPSVLRTQYAYALFTENDEAKVEDIQKKFDKMTLTYPYASDIESERELMQIAYNTKKSLAE